MKIILSRGIYCWCGIVEIVAAKFSVFYILLSVKMCDGISFHFGTILPNAVKSNGLSRGNEQKKLTIPLSGSNVDAWRPDLPPEADWTSGNYVATDGGTRNLKYKFIEANKTELFRH